MAPANWKVIKKKSVIEIEGILNISNPHNRMEVMVPEFTINPILISNHSVNKIKIKTSIKSKNTEIANRNDGYWQAFIVKSKASTDIQIKIKLNEKSGQKLLKRLESIWLDIYWINYGPFGRQRLHDGFVIPIDYPKGLEPNSIRSFYNFSLITIKTHKLGILDDPINVISNYTSKLILPGDILTIGETPLAIMQGRYHHPDSLRTDYLSRFLCMFFHPTSSLATACGMQSLINEVGPLRVIFAWIIGSLFKVIKIKGMFYRLAGEQARLIDDITGTTPPYDQMIVLGPEKVEAYCDCLSKELGIQIAVVDVNDLGRVKILGSSKGADHYQITRALTTNPAGNADQQTPIVIIRPS
ncbi:MULTISPECIES: F420-0:Gamma-glutamyl ligase [unclassified Prochlorococcus]|uniref:F420-0:Gamma-glutamyl ligase n=1 Tax=unclassified Prochlorococcus TaxID=2627481 RepID=UPI001F4C7BB0|nr:MULTISPECIES: F420-0:Gamma-glutamyl ligase [unclassified Prochlorococcus]